MLLHFLTRPDRHGAHLLDGLVDELAEKGHEVRVFHRAAELVPGDLLFVLGYLRVLDADHLSLHRHNLVVHASDLPEGRGFSPMSWQILAGRRDIPVVLFEAEEGLDTGPIYLRRILSTSGTELYHEWRRLLWATQVDLVREFVDRSASLRPVEQSGTASVYPRRTREDDRLDPSLPLAEQFDLLRVCDPDRFPAWFELRGRRYSLRLEGLEDEGSGTA